jgi:hypothetical protein
MRSVALLDLRRNVHCVGKGKAAGQFGRSQPARQFQERERVAAGFRDDPVTDRCIQATGDDGGEEGVGGFVVKTRKAQLREAHQLVLIARLADREHDPDRLREQASRNESEDLRRGGVEPLSVVHHAEERLFLREVGQQAERGQRDEKGVRRLPRRVTERDAQRVSLRLREHVDLGQHRSAQLMQASERQFHLGLDSCDLSNHETSRLTDSVSQQRRLPETRLPPDHDDPALAAANVLEQPVQVLALAGPAKEPRRGTDGHALK